MLVGQKFEFNLDPVSVSVSVSVPVPVPAPLSPSSTVTRLNTPKRKNPQDGSDQMASVSSPRRVTFVDEILSPHADSIKPKDIPITQQKAQTEHANEDLVSGLASEHSDGTGSEVSQQNGITSNGGSEHHAEGFSLGISQEQKDESILASVFSDIKEPSLSSNLAPNLSPLIVIERAINDHTSDIQIADDGPVDTNDPNSFQHRKVLPPNKSDHSQLSTTNPDSILGTDQSISVVSASIQLPKEDKLSSSSSVQDILLPVIIDLPQMNCNIDDGQVSANDNLPSEDRKKSIETEPDGISFQHTGQIVTGLLETLSPRRSERLTKQTDLKGPGFSSPMPQKQPEKLLAIGHDVENNNIFSSTEANGVFTLKTRRQLKRPFSDKENIPENRIGISNKNNINHQLELSKDISFMNSHQLLLEDRVQHVMSEPDLLSTGCSTPISDKTAPNKHSSARTPRSAISVRKSTRIAEKVTQIK